MKASLFYRIAAGLLAFFGITHTIGLFKPRTEEGAQAVVDAMRSVSMNIMGFTRSFWDFYIGFGLASTVFLLFSAVLAWQLGSLSTDQPKLARTLTWPFLAAQIAMAALCWIYFFYPPAITATLVSLCLLGAVVRGRG